MAMMNLQKGALLTSIYDSRKDEMLKYVERHHGNLQLVADEMNMTVPDLMRLCKEHKELQEAVDEARDALYESAEVKLIQKIEDGNFNAINLFFTKSPQAKSRGWGERTETQNVNWNLTDAEKAAMAKQMLGIDEDKKPDV